MRVANKYVCPYCASRDVVRIRRKPWMRTCIKSKRFFCNECHHKYLVILNAFAIKTH